MTALVRIATLATLALTFAGPARADVPPPEVEQCAGKSVGDRCGNNGICQEGSCGRATPDGMVTYSCTKCVEGTAPASEKRNCSGAPDAMGFGLFGLLAVVGLKRSTRRA